jgi:protoporphyrinogen oxidase
MFSSACEKEATVILGGGLTGLSAGYVLARAGGKVRLFEKDGELGGLSKTVIRDGFRFDLGGHRFFTKDRRINSFVEDLMGDELVSVRRTSKIFMRGKYFDYPLRPLNAMFGFGIPMTARILGDYGIEKMRGLFKENPAVSLEDWVVGNFGRTLFDIYFKQYSEKVWGLDCSMISAEWVERRIQGLSLAKAVKNAFSRVSGRDVPTLVDSFTYPELGIGRISDRLGEEIEKKNNICIGAEVERITHSGFTVDSVTVKGPDGREVVRGGEFISSLPLPHVVRMLNPAPPAEIITAASKLSFRDLVVVAVMVGRRRVTDLTWIYIPERHIPFGRIHEPTNWSVKMAPVGKTAVVAEYFSFRGDAIWNTDDEGLVDITARNLEDLGFIKKGEVLDGVVVRAPGAYPLFDIGYRDACDVVYDYLSRFNNLHLAGRGGMFRYYNMDHAIASGIETAEKILGKEVKSKKLAVNSKTEDEDIAEFPESCEEICRS